MKRYWKSKEDERIAPRVHQQGLNANEKILRHFDLSSQYGVSPSLVVSYPSHTVHQRGMLITFRKLALYRDTPYETVEASRQSRTQAAG